MSTVSNPQFSRKPLDRVNTFFRSLRLLDREIGATSYVAPLMTLLLLVLSGPEQWYFHTPIVALAFLGLVWQKLLKNTTFWYVCTTLLIATVFMSWESADNHKWLFCYWCIAICCMLTCPQRMQRDVLAKSCKALIALCMLWAVFWKAINPEYLDGSFFTNTLLLDHRFGYFAKWFGGLGSEAASNNQMMLDLLKNGHLRGMNISSIQLSSASGIPLLAQFLTWWTIGIELVIGLLFCMPRTTSVGLLKDQTNEESRTPLQSLFGTLYRYRNIALLMFAVTTYAFATVRGFGWMLMLLGFAQCERSERKSRVAFLAVFVLIQLYTLPFRPQLDSAIDYFFQSF